MKKAIITCDFCKKEIAYTGSASWIVHPDGTKHLFFEGSIGIVFGEENTGDFFDVCASCIETLKLEDFIAKCLELTPRN